MSDGYKRTALERDSHRTQIAHLLVEGVSQQAIAEKLSLSEATVSRDIAFVRAEWLQSRQININEAVGQELMRLAKIEREAWEAWEHSKKAIEMNETSGSGRHDVKVKKRTQGRIADPRYLAIIQDCINQRCKLLGLNAPERHQHEGVQGGSPIVVQHQLRVDDMADLFKQIAAHKEAERGSDT